MLQPGQEMVVTGGFADSTRAVLVFNGQHDDIGHLMSYHEDADTRPLLHAKDASNTHSRIVIHSYDTDVWVICVDLYQESNCHELWFLTGIRDKLRFIPCHSIASRIGDKVCKALPAYHAISGCDSTSALSGVGKKKCIKLLRQDQCVQDTLSLVGVQPRMTENMLQDTDTFICQMYGAACASLKTANETRYWMFCQKGQKSESCLLQQTDCIFTSSNLITRPTYGESHYIPCRTYLIRLHMDGKCQMALFNLSW
jgi:hypothetical protein